MDKERRKDSRSGSARMWCYILPLAAVVLGGLLFTRAMVAYGVHQEKRELAVVVATAATSMKAAGVATLKGSTDDNGTPMLDDLRERLQRIREANPGARFVYLMRQQQGRFVFLADAESETSPDYSPPGQAYDDQTVGLELAQRERRPVIEDPYRDQWGEWVSALAPVIDPASGKAIAVLGMDVSARDWSHTVGNYRAFALAISGLFGALVALFLFGHHRQERYNQRLSGLNDTLNTELEQRRRVEQQLELAAAVLANTGEGVVVTDTAGIIRSVNAAFEVITGFKAAEAVGRHVRRIYSIRNRRELYDTVSAELARTGRWQGEIWSRRRNGESYPQEASISVLRSGDGQPSHYAAIFHDNTLQHQLEERLNRMASLDGLTGIPNRRQFDEQLKLHWEQAVRLQQPLSLLMADLDYFKRYNDRYGHLAGDECLRRIAVCLHGLAQRPGELMARYGGEEFAMILPLTDTAGAASMAARVNAAVRELALPHEDADPRHFMTISVGHATVFPAEGSSPYNLIHQADLALYRAKGAGRDCVRGPEDVTSAAA